MPKPKRPPAPRHPKIKSRLRGNPPRAYYFTSIRGRYFSLGYDLDEAKRVFSRLMGDAGATDAQACADPVRVDPTIGELVYLFDEWGKTFSKPRTRADYTYWLKRFVRHVGQGRLAKDIRPKDVHSFVAAASLAGGWGHVKIVRATRRLFRWAMDEGHLDGLHKSPVHGLKKPPDPASPDVFYDNRQLWYMMRSIFSNNSRYKWRRATFFRDLVRFGFRTGARPEEMRIIRTEWVDLEHRKITIPWDQGAKRGLTTKRDRVIRFPRKLDWMIRRRMRISKQGFLFESDTGRPLSSVALDCAFDRMRDRQPAMFPAGCFARGLRYTFTTRAIVNGVNPIDLAHLLGHSDVSLLMKHYAKLGVVKDHLRDAADRAGG